jgi:hypothetical protein
MGGLRLTFAESGLVFRSEGQETVPDATDIEWVSTSALPLGLVTLRESLIKHVLADIDGMLPVQSGGQYKPLRAQEYSCGVLRAPATVRLIAVIDDESKTVKRLDVVALGVDLRVQAMHGTLDDFLGGLPAALTLGRLVSVDGAAIPCRYQALRHLYMESLFARSLDEGKRGTSEGTSFTLLRAALVQLRGLQTFAVNGCGVVDGNAAVHTPVETNIFFAADVLSGRVLSADVTVLAVCGAGLRTEHVEAALATEGAWMPRLEALSLAGNTIGDAGAVAVAKRCTKQRGIRTLSLQRCGIVGSSAPEFWGLLRGTGVGALDLSMNSLGAPLFWETLATFNELLNTAHLHTLDLSYSGVPSKTVWQIFGMSITGSKTTGRLRILALSNPRFVDMLRFLQSAAELAGADIPTVLPPHLAGTEDLTAAPDGRIDQSWNQHDSFRAACKAAHAGATRLLEKKRASWLQMWQVAALAESVHLQSNFVAEHGPIDEIRNILTLLDAKLSKMRIALALVLPPWIVLNMRNRGAAEGRNRRNPDSGTVVLMPWASSQRPVLMFVAPTQSAIVFRHADATASMDIPAARNIILAHVPVESVLAAVMVHQREDVDVLCTAEEVGAAVALSSKANIVHVYAHGEQTPSRPLRAPLALVPAVPRRAPRPFRLPQQPLPQPPPPPAEQEVVDLLRLLGEVEEEPNIGAGVEESGDVVMGGDLSPLQAPPAVERRPRINVAGLRKIGGAPAQQPEGGTVYSFGQAPPKPLIFHTFWSERNTGVPAPGFEKPIINVSKHSNFVVRTVPSRPAAPSLPPAQVYVPPAFVPEPELVDAPLVYIPPPPVYEQVPAPQTYVPAVVPQQPPPVEEDDPGFEGFDIGAFQADFGSPVVARVVAPPTTVIAEGAAAGIVIPENPTSLLDLFSDNPFIYGNPEQTSEGVPLIAPPVPSLVDIFFSEEEIPPTPAAPPVISQAAPQTLFTAEDTTQAAYELAVADAFDSVIVTYDIK